MKVTEQASNYANLDKMSVGELLQNMNREDKNVPVAVEKCIPQIEKLVEGIVERMKKGGRLFYLGAGTSGRLGILDASEIPPTYGAPFDLIIGLIAVVNLQQGIEWASSQVVTLLSARLWRMQRMTLKGAGEICSLTMLELTMLWWVLQHREQHLM